MQARAAQLEAQLLKLQTSAQITPERCRKRVAALERVAADEAAERHTLDEFVQLEQATGVAKAAAASQPSQENMDSLTAALADAKAELGDREQQISSLQAQLSRAKRQVQEKEQLLQQGAFNIQAAEAEVAVIHGSNLQMFRYVSANIQLQGACIGCHGMHAGAHQQQCC